MPASIRLALGTVLTIVSSASPVLAQRFPVPLQELAPSSPLELFGWSLALDGDTLAVGATNADGPVARSGVVYVYTRSGGAWIQEARLAASDAVMQGWFGSAVSLRGDVLAVGTPSHGNVGRAYVFRRVGTTWSEEANLPSPATGPNPRFGTQVVLLADSVLVSAPNAGSVYRYDRVGSTWTLAPSLAPSSNAWFGEQLRVDGTHLLASASYDGLPPDHAIEAFEWIGGAWVREAPIHVRRLAHAGLGSSFDVQGDTLLAGCPGADLYGTDAGAAFFWTREPWGWHEGISLQDCIPDGNFGSGIELDGDTALVGARNDDEGGPFLGSWKVFRRAAGVWSLETKVVLPDAFESQSWPGPALLAGDRVFVASPQANGSRGRVVEFRLVEPQHALVCVASPENGLCAPCFDGSLMRGGCENGAVNCGTQLGASGTASVSADGLVLRARGLPLTASAVLFQGDALAAPVPFGAGRLCVGGGLVRIARIAARSGQWTYPRPGDPSISVAGGIPSAGGLRHYQLAYRDVEGFCGGLRANVTNGVSVAWGS